MKHILIVDDDVHINQMLEEVLTSAGYKVTHAYSGTEAILLIPSIKPDLILLDLMLPGLSGEEIIEEISHIPVIVISAKIDTKNKISLLLNGAVDYVTKPFDVDELLARIVAQLRHSQTNSINSVLEHGDIRLDLNTRTETVINNVLEDCISSYYAIFKEKGITPNINLCEQKIVRSVDKTALLRIFNNVIDNAIKYSEGDLTISLFENGKIVFSNHTSDLNEIQIGKLFDRFYTVNTARKSTGLGLSIAKALIEKMDGNISADYSNNVLSIIIKLNEV